MVSLGSYNEYVCRLLYRLVTRTIVISGIEWTEGLQLVNLKIEG